MDMFKSLNERAGRTIVMVTHNPEYRKYATQIISMEDGKVVKREAVKRRVFKPSKIPVKAA